MRRPLHKRKSLRVAETVCSDNKLHILATSPRRFRSSSSGRSPDSQLDLRNTFPRYAVALFRKTLITVAGPHRDYTDFPIISVPRAPEEMKLIPS
jgi:hypothetical protein